jgi:AcrR family transcriptional regulator
MHGMLTTPALWSIRKLKRFTKFPGRRVAATTRHQIVTAALRQFQLFGFQHTSVDSIADALGISKKTLYQHFRSKDQLIRAVVDEIADTVMKRAEVVTAATTPPARALRRVAEVGHYLSQTITPAMVHDMRSMPQVWAYVESKRATALTSLGALIRRGQESGDVRRDLDPGFISAMLLQLVNALINPTMMTAMNLAPGVMVRNIVTMILRGVLVHKTTPKKRKARHALVPQT